MKKTVPDSSLDHKDDKNGNIEKNDSLGKNYMENKLNERIIQLEKELQYNKEYLQTLREEHYIYKEELLNTNEEFQSANDELLKTNTSYEDKIQELANLYDDMTNYLNSSDIGTIFLDENLCIRKFTPNITKEINLKAHDIGRPLWHISNNLINEDINASARKVMNSHRSSEKEIQSENGRWYLLKCSPYCSTGNIIKGVVLSLIDITRSKNAEIEISRSKEKYEQLVENSPFSIYIIQNGKFYFSNSAGLKLLKVNDVSELMSTHFGYYFDVDEEELIKNTADDMEIKGKPIVPKEGIVNLPDGTVLLVEISTMPFQFDGSPAKLLLVRDVSFLIKERLLEEENERNIKLLNETILTENLKTEFFSNLSHELKTPINVILSALQLLDIFISSGDVKDHEKEFKKYSNIMKQNCYRQLRLANNLIDITKVDAGFFELKLQNYNIVSVVENTTLSVAEYIKTKSIKLIFDTDIEECIISCDPEMIERVILNLLSNSIKFTKPDGSITVNIYDKRDTIIISIKDTGIGVPNDKLDVIFDRFRQVDKSFTRNQEGSGIGLSIVKSLVELHGGKVSVLSEYGKGTEFIIELPVKPFLEENGISPIIEADSNELIQRLHIEFSDIYSLD